MEIPNVFLDSITEYAARVFIGKTASAHAFVVIGDLIYARPRARADRARDLG